MSEVNFGDGRDGFGEFGFNGDGTTVTQLTDEQKQTVGQWTEIPPNATEAEKEYYFALQAARNAGDVGDLDNTYTDTVENREKTFTDGSSKTPPDGPPIPEYPDVPRLPQIFLLGADGRKYLVNAPRPGDVGYSEALMAFKTNVTSNPDASAHLYQAFLENYPPDSPERVAFLKIMNYKLGDDANLVQEIDLFKSALEGLLEDGVLETFLGRTMDSFKGSPKIPVKELTKEALQSMSPEEIALYSDGEIQEIINKFPELTQEITEKAIAELFGLNLEEFVAARTEKTASEAEAAELAKLGDGLKVSEDLCKSAIEILRGKPDSPEKETMLNFLQKVAQAIAEFTQLLYALQTNDSEKMRELVAAKLDETLDKIAKQQKALRKQIKAKRKAKKKKKYEVLTKMIQTITAVVLTVIAVAIVCLGWACPLSYIVAALLIMTAADMMMSVAGEKEGAWQKAFDGIADLTEKMCKSMGMSEGMTEHVVKAAKCTTVVVIWAVMICTGAFLIGGSETMKSTLAASGMVKNKLALMIIGFVIDAIVIVIWAVIAIAMIATGILAPGGIAALTALLAYTAVRVTLVTIGILSLVFTIVMGIMSIINSTNQAILAEYQMTIKRQLANIEEETKLREAIIELLKKAIKALQESLENISSTLSEVQGSTNAMWKKLNIEMEKLNQAIV